jgi:DNA-binding protein HU-beta
MNKSEFIQAMAEKSGLSVKDATAALNATLETIQESLRKGEPVSFVGFGTFEVKERAARTGRNPRTKQPVEIPASKVPSFKAGKSLKEAVNH